MAQTIYIIDGSGFMHRAFHAFRNLSTSTGIPTSATFGFLSMLKKLVRDYKPEYIAVVFDVSKKSFRNDFYPEYKANREPTHPDLILQFDHVRSILRALNLPLLELQNFEADDIIGTITKKALLADFHVMIISSDKDLMQLVNDRVSMLDTMKNKIYSIPEVIGKLGVPPEKIPDLIGIMGDPSDNIPGVRGIGEKGGVELISAYGDLDGVYASIEKISGRKKELLAASKEKAMLSRKLAVLDCSVPLDFEVPDLKKGEPDIESLKKILTDLEFLSVLNELNITVQPESKPFPQIKIINGTDEIKSLIQKARISPRVAIYFIADHKDFLNPEIIAFGIALDENEGFGISVEQSGTDVLKDFFDMAVTGQDVLICHNFKELHRIFSNHGFDIHSCSLDTMLASYLLNPQREKHGMENMMLEYLGLKFDMMKDAKSAAACASILIRLASLIREKIEKNRLDFLLHDVEIPLSAVLSRMEKTGIRCDSLKLLEISSQISKRILELEKDIYFHAGTHFNISSPKQLSDILFTKMRLTSSRKTKTGFSTDQSVLEEISDQHLIVDLILEHRSLMKLKTTYTDVLPELIHPATKRIHTSFNQVVTATGRLSSSDPNLQNIPIRTEIGKSIREAFIADEGHVLLSADYSQIELRILAYLSSDERLIETFMNNEDIHQRTACEIFNVNPQSVTPDMRRAAKVVNFGILYGMSAFRLSRDLKISTHDAKNFMEKYFSRYPGVRKFIDDTIESARDRGYVSTILNRIRYIPDINSSNKNVRGFAERTAVNTPVQGSAADIIKLAMINVQKEIDQKNLKTKMVLQVHDELVFVVPEKELDIFKAAVRNRMENVMENISLKLKVPLVVDIGIGRNWSQAHG